VLPQELVNLFDGTCRQADSLPLDAPKFSQHHLARYEAVFGKHHAQYICAHSPGCKGADQDVCVEENPQETSRATSSSVRYPRASANGSALRRSRSNLSRLSCRRRASRTSSLRVLPVCLQSRSRSFSRSGSSRMVTADLMSYNVLRISSPRQCGVHLPTRPAGRRWLWRGSDQIASDRNEASSDRVHRERELLQGHGAKEGRSGVHQK